MPKPYKSMKHRLLANIEIVGECWVWICKKNDSGYGHINVYESGKHKTKKAHRVSYETFVGKIPEGLHIDHRCNNRSCINPAHLEIVTIKENHKRRVIRRRIKGGEEVSYG